MQEQGSGGGGSSMLRTRPNTIIRGDVQGEYVVRGAKIKCSKALKEEAYDVVNLPLCHGVYSGKEPLINIKDMKDGENIVNGFGICSETGTPCVDEMKFHINWINRKKIRLHVEGEEAVTTKSFTMCSAHGGEITFENSGQTAVFIPKNEKARDEALELQGTASYLTENNNQYMVSLSNDTKHVSFGVMGTTYDSSENYVQYSDESKKEELRPKLTEAEKAINQKNVLEALQTKDVDHVKELLARRELISPDGSPYAYYKVATRQGVEYIVLFTEEQHNQGLAAGAVGVVAVASLGGAAVLATCTVEQLAAGATAYGTSILASPDLPSDMIALEMSVADGDPLGIVIDTGAVLTPGVFGGAGTAKNITEDSLEALVKDGGSYLDDAVDVTKTSEDVLEEVIKLNPLDNPKIAKDISADPDAVYGYIPKEGSSLEQFDIDWTNTEEVAKARAARLEYLEAMELKKAKISSEVDKCLSEGKNISEIAEMMVNKRNTDRINSYLESENLDGLNLLYERNIIEYGRKEGPDLKYLYEKYGSYEEVIYSSVKVNQGMNVLLGIK